MILVYIVRIAPGCSGWDENELRYSLRSVEKYGRNVDKIVIAGDKPAWLTNVTHSPIGDPYPLRYNNTWHKMKMLCHNINEPFCLMNDDFFLTAETDFNAIPDYYDGDINSLTERYRRINTYTSVLYSTRHVLVQNGRPLRNHAVHYPMIIHPQKIREYFGLFVDEPGISFRLLYGNVAATQPVELPDLKLSHALTTEEVNEKLRGKTMFSIGDGFLATDGKNYLQHLYPEKSKYEL